MFSSTALLILGGIYVLVYIAKRLRARGQLPLPPGPRPLPVIGNALDMPSKGMPEAFHDMSAKYGEVVYMNAFGVPVILLGSHEAAQELLEKRSAKYSDRPMSVTSTLIGWDWSLPVLRYGPWWRRSRRAFHEQFRLSEMPRHRPVLQEASRHLVARLLNGPKDFSDHIRHTFVWIIMHVSYGIDIEKESFPYMEMAAQSIEAFSEAFQPGNHFMEIFPVLRYLPTWFPGTGLKRKGAAWTPTVHKMRDAPWEASRTAMKEGTVSASIVATLLEQMTDAESPLHGETEELIRDTAATVYVGGTDTNVSTLLVFFLAMASHPEAQKKAQAELDRVVGPHRLPNIEDRPALPYTHAILLECLRWHPIAPLGLRHCALEDDEFRGYLIPKGSHIIANAWSFTRDTRVYPDPEAFIPVSQRWRTQSRCSGPE